MGQDVAALVELPDPAHARVHVREVVPLSQQVQLVCIEGEPPKIHGDDALTEIVGVRIAAPGRMRAALREGAEREPEVHCD